MIEFAQVLNCNKHPFVLAGDFNLIRKASESNKVTKGSKWTGIFNAIIEHWELKDLEIAGRFFTWSNNHSEPLFKKLDRVLVSIE
jgi:hypothetical protein